MPNIVERGIIFELTQAIVNVSRVEEEVVTTEMPTEPPTTPEPGSGEVMEDKPRAEPSVVEKKQPQREKEGDFNSYNAYDDPDVPYLRQRRQAVDSDMMFEDQLIQLALEHENACNPVLRASANAVLER